MEPEPLARWMRTIQAKVHRWSRWRLQANIVLANVLLLGICLVFDIAHIRSLVVRVLLLTCPLTYDPNPRSGFTGINSISLVTCVVVVMAFLCKTVKKLEEKKKEKEAKIHEVPPVCGQTELIAKTTSLMTSLQQPNTQQHPNVTVEQVSQEMTERPSDLSSVIDTHADELGDGIEEAHSGIEEARKDVHKELPSDCREPETSTDVDRCTEMEESTSVRMSLNEDLSLVGWTDKRAVIGQSTVEHCDVTTSMDTRELTTASTNTDPETDQSEERDRQTCGVQTDLDSTTQLSPRSVDVCTTTEGLEPPPTGCVCHSSTMTDNLYIEDVSLSTSLAICRHSSTVTTGPFMKKLRRAHRVLQEAKVKVSRDQVKTLTPWRQRLERYRDKIKELHQDIVSKDQLIGVTAATRRVLEEEIQSMAAQLRHSQDNLATKHDLNNTLKAGIEETKGMGHAEKDP